VNTLLDFSRIEAGRVQATYRPIDLAAFTADLASNFRSACERAGLTLTVDCRATNAPAFASACAMETPRPPVEPVTSAVRPVSRVSFGLMSPRLDR